MSRMMARILFTIVITLVVVFIGYWFIITPLQFPFNHLLRTTTISRVETENRPLREVVQEVVAQVKAKSGKKIRVIFSPENLAEWIREKDGGVFGNPPVEGKAKRALIIISWDYHCHVAFLGDDTILFYK